MASLSQSVLSGPARILRRTPFQSPHGRSATSHPRQRLAPPKAFVETSVVIAVTQQAVAYALVLGGEAAFSRSDLMETNKGRPEILPVAAGIVASLGSAYLLNSGPGPTVTVGLISGLLTSGTMMAYNIKRTADTTDDDIAPDWPGPKAWPATMTLISFFALNVFLQGLRAEL